MTWPHFLDTILCNGFVLAAEPLGNGSYVCAEHSQRRCGGDRRKILALIPPGQHLDLASDIFPALARDGPLDRGA